jgi:glycogen operon protein
VVIQKGVLDPGETQRHRWNCGHERDEGVPAEVLVLRRKQVTNFFCQLMLSNCIPMFPGGDELLNAQFGT